MTTLKTECRKFAPNIFNKTKCQNCFRTKDAHSAEALESNRATRKVSKCGYLFVAPDWDFSVSINRTKRWQRRWFVLYDDGELTYSVDEHPDTVPQAVIDMNKVLEVSDAEDVTGNQFAVALTAPEKVHFVKGTSKEESKWWFDVLSRFPRNTVRGKHKRNATFPGGKATTTTTTDNTTSEENSNKESICAPVSRTRFLSANTETTNRIKKEWWHQVDRPDEDVFPTKENGSYIIENIKSSTPIDRGKSGPVGQDCDLNGEMVTTENVNNVLNKLISTSTSSVPASNDNKNLISSSSKRDNVKNGIEGLQDDIGSKDRIQMNEASDIKEGRSRRYLKRESRGRKSQRSRSDGVAKMIPPFPGKESDGFGVWPHIDNSHTPSTKTYHHNPVYLLLSDAPSMKRYESLESLKTDSSSPLLSRRRHTSEKEGVVRCISFTEKREFPQKDKSLKKSGSLVNIALDSLDWRNHSNMPNETSVKTSTSFYRGNQVSEGSIKQPVFYSSMKPVRDTDVEPQGPFVKKGWLMRQNLTKEWYKHWFVLKNTSLTYYRDPTAEDSGILDGVLDLGQVTGVDEIELDRNYAFSLTMWDSKKHVLSAVTAGIRNNWIQAIRHAATLCDATPKKELPGERLGNEAEKYLYSDCKGLGKGSIPSSPIQPHREPEKPVDISSSDDQSEYFSIVDEEETVDRSSSPRALPPSPPLNRTPMSLVKERARSRIGNSSQGSRQCGSCGTADGIQHSGEHQSDGTASDHSEVFVVDSPMWDRKKYKECSNRLLDSKWQQDGMRDPSEILSNKKEENLSSAKQSLEKISRLSSDIEKHNSQIELLEFRCKDLELKLIEKEKEISEKCSELDSLRTIKASYLDLVEKHNNLRKKLQDYCKPSTGSTTDENYRLKYELLKNKYMRERAEWEAKLKKEKLHNTSSSCKEGKDNSVEDFLRVVQKSRDQLNEIKDRLQNSEEKNEHFWVLWKELVKLCEEAEKMSPNVDKKTKKDMELKKLKRSISELQSLCSNRQHKLEDEQKKLNSLYSSLDTKENEVKQLRKELEQSREKNVNLSNKVKQLEAAIFVDISSDSASTSDQGVLMSRNAQIKARFEMAKEEIKRLKKELREAHASYDDLEINCITLRQEAKNVEEVHKSQIALMTARVDDLTSKLTVSERNLRHLKQRLLKVETKQERRKSSLKNKESLSLSKEYEAKLAELEQKITCIETLTKEEKSKSDVMMSDIRAESEDIAPEKHLQKRSSLDSSGSENASLLLRLHTLGVRVQSATEVTEKHLQMQKDKDEEVEGLEKPKICLQVKSDEDCSLQEEGEDWSTLSFTTSMTDLQAIDADDNEFPCSVGDCLDYLGQKVDGLLSWLRTSLQLLQRQEHGTLPGPVKTSSSFGYDGNYLSNLVDVLEYLSEAKMEETFDPSSGGEKVVVASIFYKLLLLHEVSRILHRLSSGDNVALYDHLSVVNSALSVLSNHLSYVHDALNDGGPHNATAVNDITAIVNNLVSTCNDLNMKDPLFSTLNQNAEDSTLYTNHLTNSVNLLQVQCKNILDLFDEIKESKFSAIWQALTETPVQDPEGRFHHRSEISDTSDDIKDGADQEPLLASITQVITQVFKIAENQLLMTDLHLNNLSQKSEVLNSWTSVVHATIKAEMNALLEELKKHCPQSSEAGAFLSPFTKSERKNVLPNIAELAHTAVCKTVAQSILTFVRNGLNDTTENTDRTDAAVSDKVHGICPSYLHEELYHCMLNLAKDGAVSFVHNSRSVAKKLEKMSLESSLNIAQLQMQHAKEMEKTKGFYRKRVERLQNELSFLQQEQEEYRKESCRTCAELQKNISHLQKDLDAVIASQRSCRCEELGSELHSVIDKHQRELCAIEEHHQQEVESSMKQMQIIMDQKEKIHSEEVKKLEDQLQIAQKKLKHLEIEYDEQIQSLCELCEQKLAQKHDPINEEAIRRRYQSEIEQLKYLCEKGIVAMENSHKRIISELEQRHKQEVAQLEAEKEKVLAEETQATLTALEVMRKAHEEELQQQIAKFKDEFIRRMQMDHSESLQKEQETELGEIKHEILSLSEKYSVKCLETASFAEQVEALSHQLKEANHQLFDLLARNKQLQVHLAIDIEQKREDLEGKETTQTVEELKKLLKLRESELVEQREENAQLQQNLHVTQMHVSMLDIQCQQLDQSLKAERRLREDEVSSLRTRLDSIILASAASNEENSESPFKNDSEHGSRGRTSLYRSPSLTLSRRFLELRPHRNILSASRTRELMRSPSCPGLDGSQVSSSW